MNQRVTLSRDITITCRAESDPLDSPHPEYGIYIYIYIYPGPQLPASSLYVSGTACARTCAVRYESCDSSVRDVPLRVLVTNDW
jgi:hypothetical protein